VHRGTGWPARRAGTVAGAWPVKGHRTRASA
jgi:hypothetical protein